MVVVRFLAATVAATTAFAADLVASQGGVTLLPTTNLLADGSNTYHYQGPPNNNNFQLDTATPTLTWAPRHTGGFLRNEDVTYSVSISTVAGSEGKARAVFSATNLSSPQLTVPPGALSAEGGVSYEWTVDAISADGQLQSVSAPARFHVGLLDPASWDNTEWIGSTTTNLYRAEFAADNSDIAAADLYICGLGYSQVHLNGQPMPISMVTSPWSNNAKRNPFSWFNATDMITDGSNAIGVALGHGWRDTSKFPRHDPFWTGDATDRVLRAQMKLTFKNGTVQTVAATGSGAWTTTAGPITADSVYDGETFDARLEQVGWTLPGYDASAAGFASWTPAQRVADGPKGVMVPWAAPAVSVSQALEPISIKPHGSSSSPTCGSDPEKGTIDLQCDGADNSIASVVFAAYGMPTGTCDAGFQHNPKCDADISKIVASACVGKQNCTVECDNTQCNGQPLAGGDPCYLTAKHVAVDVKCSKPSPEPTVRDYIVDFGKNLAGVVQLTGIKEAAGTIITLRHAEILQHSGIPGLPNPDPSDIYQDNLRSAKATDTYICRGDPAGENYTATMTYHGFRFVSISGLSTAPTAANLRLLHFHSNVAHRAQANFSSPTLNKILTMAIGSQESNMMSVPTDCDQRDERLGWMGDADLSSDSMCINFDCSAFFKSYLFAMSDEMGDDGSLTDTVPWVRYGGRPGDVSWASAFPQYVYTLYKSQGDIATAKTYFPQVLMLLGDITSQASAKGICNMHTPYGDWCPPPSKPGQGQGAKPTSPYTSVFSYVNMAYQAAELAKAIGDTGNYTALSKMANGLMDQFNGCFDNNASGAYDNGVMTADVLALQLGAPGAVAPSATTEKVQEHLVSTIQAADNHFTTGIIGFKFLFKQLDAAKHSDIAHAILEQTTYPSIGYEATNTLEPATYNLWELTDGPFEGTGMNSRNHHMFSSFSLYLQEDLAGVQFDHEADEDARVTSRLQLKPASVLGLSMASSSLQLRQGEVTHQWQRHGGVQCGQAAGDDALTIDCGVKGGSISSIDFALLGPVPAGTCGAFLAHCGQDLTSLVASMCVGKSSCVLVPNEEASKANLNPSDMCVRDHYGEATALAVQATCSVETSIVELRAEVPLGVDRSLLKLPPNEVFTAAAGADNTTQRIVYSVRNNIEAEVFRDGGTPTFSASDGVWSVETLDDGTVALELGAGAHHLHIASK